MISRRTFQRLVATLAIGRVSTLPWPHARATDKLPAGDYVDMHTHLGQTWNTTEPLTAEVLLRWMNAHRVAQAVVLPLIAILSGVLSLRILTRTQPVDLLR